MTRRTAVARNGGAATDSKPPDAASVAGDGTRIDGIPPPRPGSSESAASQSAKDGPQNGARMGGARPTDSTGTRRKSVVFEEDDELDVPDFLK